MCVHFKTLGRGGGVMVRVLAFYSDGLSLNPVAYQFFGTPLQKDENK